MTVYSTPTFMERFVGGNYRVGDESQYCEVGQVEGGHDVVVCMRHAVLAYRPNRGIHEPVVYAGWSRASSYIDSELACLLNVKPAEWHTDDGRPNFRQFGSQTSESAVKDMLPNTEDYEAVHRRVANNDS